LIEFVAGKVQNGFLELVCFPLSIHIIEVCGNAVLGNAQGGDLIQSHIEVIATSGDVIEIDLPSTSTIKDVKCTLQAITMQPMYCSKLIWGGQTFS
jgi:hypothetical protein